MESPDLVSCIWSGRRLATSLDWGPDEVGVLVEGQVQPAGIEPACLVDTSDQKKKRGLDTFVIVSRNAQTKKNPSSPFPGPCRVGRGS